MSKQCAICGKGSQMGGKRNLLRGKYNPTPKKRKYPNLQWATFPDGHREKICTRCLKKNLHLKQK
ncbi:MAG: 50S ribosomal protein L28 [Candidatus Tagabacteria bacterium CG09_land_8_20_14_0_10_41_14]|uniref:50S ribosomal protein L28 n=2 Tax=Candidatus Tagaibacteriota TaxID=1817918 RepID=A0A2H0WLY2_9BACT|nr:MAG: 50S ribosomal protein L28 [Candidatus Tagabacteria bacterium CG09_land_8_20_14_0_10_41_14]PJE73360.1 MAG: 50S ribosomal protein L28 [Candidatus Tagabacteria bacterium CG10_big_fil_rev_8_21_14_0_10_40_13]